MHPVLAQIGPFTLYSWGLFVGIGFLTALLVSLPLGRRLGISSETLMDFAVFLIVASLIGARTFYVIEFWHDFTDQPWRIFMIQHGGLVFYGGFILAVLVALWFSKRRGISLLRLLDAAFPGGALGYAIGRIGCFFNGCCFGIETNVPWAVHFPNLPGTRHPTQLYSSVSGLLIFFFLLWVWSRRKKDGEVTFWGLTLYGIYRFIVEFFRYSPDHIFGLTPSQYICIIIFGVGVWGLTRLKSR